MSKFQWTLVFLFSIGYDVAININEFFVSMKKSLKLWLSYCDFNPY